MALKIHWITAAAAATAAARMRFCKTAGQSTFPLPRMPSMARPTRMGTYSVRATEAAERTMEITSMGA